MTPLHTAARFEFSTAKYRLSARGIAERLNPTTWDGPSVARAVEQLLDQAMRNRALNGRPLIVGAIPFDTTRPAHLYLPQSTRWDAPLDSNATTKASRANRTPPPLHVTEPDPALYREAVRRAVAQIHAGDLEKVVLARIIRMKAAQPFCISQLFSTLQLNNPSAYTFMLDLPDSAEFSRGPHSYLAEQPVLIGASPELVLASADGSVSTCPLAGSAPRLTDADEDSAIGHALLRSPKERAEHAVVARMAIDTVSEHATDVHVPDTPQLVQTPKLWHLGTPISGQLRPNVSAMELLYALHPTPAVCGWPTEVAKQAISELEDFDRGLYAGVVGWIDSSGTGEWALVLRSGIVHGDSATLHAGAGIVAASDPHAEYVETAVKFDTVASALGQLDRNTRSLQVTTSEPVPAPDEAAARIRRDLAAALNVDPGSIDDQDNLFDHGLDSIRLMSLVEAWDSPQRPVDFAALLTDPRIASWAQMLRA